jgi:prepilin-type N-terminal cleavage/methylation domain-containing protein/prepilin-type processing-associated H-X9-DG protein
MKLRTKQRGFTLIELLVVIAIIAILAALLLPSLSSAKRSSTDLKCVNNCKELLLSMTMYIDDAKGKLMSYYDSSLPGSDTLWIARLQTDYAASQGVRCCPATTVPNPVSAWTAPSDNAGSGLGTADYPWLWTGNNGTGGTTQYIGSYGLNGYCYADSYEYGYPPSDPANNPDYFYKQVSNVPRTSLTPYFSDDIWVDGWPLEGDTPPPDLYAGASPGPLLNGGLCERDIARHGYKGAAGAAPKHVNPAARLPGKINVAFIDGHVEMVSLEDLWTLYWHLGWNPPNPRPL